MPDPLLPELIRTTRQLLDYESYPIVFKRTEFIETAGGGLRRVDGDPDDTPIDLFFGAVAADPTLQVRLEGETLVVSHVLVGMPEDDIREKDEFTWENRNFRVVQVHPDRSFETRAWVVERV